MHGIIILHSLKKLQRIKYQELYQIILLSTGIIPLAFRASVGLRTFVINCNKKYWDCDQSNYSSRIILSHIPAKCIHLKFSKMTWGRLLDLVQPEVDPYTTPTPETTLVPTCR